MPASVSGMNCVCVSGGRGVLCEHLCSSLFVCVFVSSITCTGATALNTGLWYQRWTVGSRRGVTWLRPPPRSPSLHRHLTVESTFNILSSGYLHVFLNPTVFILLFLVKNISELSQFRQTPSPSQQSCGGYRTDHGRWQRHVMMGKPETPQLKSV